MSGQLIQKIRLAPKEDPFKEICLEIISATNGGSLLKQGNVPDFKFKTSNKEHVRYEFYDSSKVTPMELLIHNNCQKQVRNASKVILDPDLKLTVLEKLILVAASAKNFPLWKELITSYKNNDHFKAKDPSEQFNFLKSLAVDKTKLASLPSSPSYLCRNGVELAFNSEVSIQSVRTGADFFSKTQNSLNLTPFLFEKYEWLLKNQYTSQKYISEFHNHLDSFVRDSQLKHLINAYEVKYPHIFKHALVVERVKFPHGEYLSVYTRT